MNLKNDDSKLEKISNMVKVTTMSGYFIGLGIMMGSVFGFKGLTIGLIIMSMSWIINFLIQKLNGKNKNTDNSHNGVQE